MHSARAEQVHVICTSIHAFKPTGQTFFNRVQTWWVARYSRVQNEVPLLFIGWAGPGSALAAAAWYLLLDCAASLESEVAQSTHAV